MPTKKTKTVPRLDATALKTITKAMRQNKHYLDLVQSTPFLKDLVQTVKTNVGPTIDKKRVRSVVARFVHLNLIHALMVLFSHEPDCLVGFSFPRRHMKVDFYTDRDDQHHRFYLVDVYKKGQLLRQMSFWDRDEFVSYLIGLLETSPKEVVVFRSSLHVSGPAHVFIRQVKEAFGETQVSPRMVRMYDQKQHSP